VDERRPLPRPSPRQRRQREAPRTFPAQEAEAQAHIPIETMVARRDFAALWEASGREVQAHLELGASTDDLVEIHAVDPLTGTSMPVSVPSEWSLNFRTGGVSLQDVGFGEDVYEAGLVADVRSRVCFKVADADCITTQREISIVERLCGECGRLNGTPGSRASSGHVVSYFESKTIGDKAYFLMQPAGPSLVDFIDFEMYGEDAEAEVSSCLHLPLRVSLPILIDILRGLVDLEAAGVLHGALTAKTVMLSRTKASTQVRALISGLSGACFQRGDPDHAQLCARLADDEADFFVTSPLSQPPDAKNGAPVGPSDHVWSAGIILAQMCFSYNPLEEAILRRYPSSSISEFDRLDRRFVRDFAAEHFTIQEDAFFAALPSDLQRLLSRMLEVDPRQRLTTAAALDEAKALARARGIAIAARLKSVDLPDAWRSRSSGMR